MSKANGSKGLMAEGTDAIEVWREAAEALPTDELKLSIPIHVLVGEAVDVAKFFAKYWDDEVGPKKVVVRPGLHTAVNKRSQAPAKLTAATGDEILSLRRAVQAASTAYLLAVDPAAANPMERATYVLGKITGTLEWLFDDGVEDENDAQLAALGTEHDGDPSTPDALAGALVDYAALAETHRHDLDGLGSFDVAMIDEAKELADALADRPTEAAQKSAEARAALARRNRLVTLLNERVAKVRSAARFVFAEQPEIVREASSAYERRRRAAARRAKQKAPAAAPAQP